MPQQRNRVSFPMSASTRGKRGQLLHKHRVAWLNAIVTKRGERRMYIKQTLPGVGEQVIWVNVAVCDKMIQFLVDYTGKPLRGLSKAEKIVLFEPSRKERKAR